MFNKQSEEIWKDIPLNHLIGYQVSSFGKIRHHGREIILNKDDKGYVRVELPTIDGNTALYNVHRLVCLTFNEIPSGFKPDYAIGKHDGIPFIVNHKNKNKSDNYYKNLEWCDNKFNINHARNQKHFAQLIRVIVHDRLTNKYKEFNSINQIADFFVISKNEVIDIIMKHDIEPFLKRYIFIDPVFNIENNLLDKKVNIIYKDYVSQQIENCDSILALSKRTGVKYKDIKRSLNTRIIRKSNKLIAGYVFKYGNQTSIEWPLFSVKDAESSRMGYFYRLRIREDKRLKSVKVTITNTNQTRLFTDLASVYRYYNIQKRRTHVDGDNKEYNDILIVGDKVYQYIGKAFECK